MPAPIKSTRYADVKIIVLLRLFFCHPITLQSVFESDTKRIRARSVFAFLFGGALSPLVVEGEEVAITNLPTVAIKTTTSALFSRE